MSLFQFFEAIAVLLALAYLILAARENIWCWACAFGSTAIYIVLFFSVSLLSEFLLNIFYLVMAVYGWWQWQRGSQHGNQAGERKIHSWTARQHVGVILVTTACIPLLGTVTAAAGAAYPYLDATTTCFAVVTTFMVTHKVLENWLYWLAIDALSIYLFLAKELYLTAGLFVLYLAICAVGYLSWRRKMMLESAGD